MPVTPLDFPEFVITTDSEQRWQIYNAITTGVTTVGPLIGPLPAGSNSIGTVGLNAGTNAIGSITNTSFGVSTLPALPTGSNTIGSINAVGSITNALPAGTNVIGGVTLTRASTATRSDFTAAVDTQIVAASTTRPMLSIYNVGPAVLRIGLGSTVTSSTNFTYLLNAGDTYVANPNEVTLEHRAIFAAAGSVAEVTIGA